MLSKKNCIIFFAPPPPILNSFLRPWIYCFRKNLIKSVSYCEILNRCGRSAIIDIRAAARFTQNIYSGPLLRGQPLWKGHWTTSISTYMYWFLPLTRGHPSWKAIFLVQKGWPHKRGSTLYAILIYLNTYHWFSSVVKMSTPLLVNQKLTMLC